MKLSEYINKYSEGKKVDSNVIEFGLEMTRDLTIAMIIALIDAIIFDKILETIFFLMILIPLRQNAGGFHTKSRLSCGILSFIILTVALYSMSKITLNSRLQLILCIISIIIIFALAPVDNINNQLEDIEISVYREKTRKILVFELLLFMILFILCMVYWSSIIVISFIVTSILLVIGYVQNIIVN